MKGKLRIKININTRKYARMIYLLAAIALMAIGGYVAYLGNDVGNPLLILLGFAGLAGGFMLFLTWRNMGTVRVLRKHTAAGKEGVEEEPPNSLVLYPDSIDFIHVLNPFGQSKRCYNDKQYYYIYKAEKVGAELSEFRLPDDDESERYYDPQEFANPVTMPSNKKYFTWSASLMQQVSVGILAVIIISEIVGLIAIV